jgi:hypothetical protein
MQYMTNNQFSAVMLILSLVSYSSVSMACPDDQYEQCFLGACACLPKVGGAVGDGAEHLKREVSGQTGGPILEQWLIASRNSAIGTSQPIPPQIRQALTGYIEEDILNRARFKVGDNGILNLAGLTIAYGDSLNGSGVSAVTLIDLIVFQNENDAYNNPSLWAHELTHVKQFRDWGTRDFSIRYTRDSNGVENQAYAVGNNYNNWRTSQNQFQQSAYPSQQIQGIICGTPAGTCRAAFYAPIGSPCGCGQFGGSIVQ